VWGVRGLLEWLWLPVLLWAIAIFAFSTPTFSRDNTAPLVMAVIEIPLPHINVGDLFGLQNFMRKCIHPIEYFLLSLLLFRAIRGRRAGWQLQWALVAFLLSAIWAVSDEFHQTFTPNRTASMWDVLLDVTGAALGQIAAWAALCKDSQLAPSTGRES